MVHIRYTKFLITPVIFVALFFFTSVAFAGTGFVESPLWFTPETPKEGDLLTLSALFRNAEKENLSGTVVFYDGEVLLGKKPITIVSGGIATATISFTITAGDHRFSASMASVSRVSGGGASTPFTTPIEKVELPKQFVAKQTSINTTADPIVDFSAPILKQVAVAEEKIGSVIPESIKKPVVETAQKVDAWRAKDAVIFTENKETAKSELEKTKAVPAKGKVTATTSSSATDGPMLYVKLVWFTVVAFLFSTPLVFYGLGVFLLFLILRFFYRKIRGR